MITVKAIGVVVDDNAHFLTTLGGKPVVLTDGYTMERAVWEAPVGGSQGASSRKRVAANTHVVLAYKDAHADQTGAEDSTIPRFRATVQLSKVGQPPLITVVRSDDPEKKCYSSDKSLTAAWREALQEAAKDFPETPVAETKAPNGLRLMGLHLMEVTAEIRSLAGGEAAFAKAESAMATRKAETVVDEAPSVQSTPGVIVTDSKPAQKRSRASASAKVASNTGAVADAAAAPATARRRRKTDPAPTATPNEAVASASKEVLVVCPDCGLAGTPFCAATGKPHEAAPCPKCGLTSAFCPVTGEAHSGAIQRTNRERGEVHLPGAQRRASKKAASAAATAGETAESAVTVEGTPVKKTSTRRKRTAGEAAIEGDTDQTGGSASTADIKKRRTRSSKTTASVDGQSTSADGKRQTTISESATPAAEPSLADIALKEPDVYIYPTLRPPLSQTEQRRAQHSMEQRWHEKASEPVLPVMAQALYFPLVPAKRRTAAGTAGAARRGKKAKAEPNENEDEDEDEDHDVKEGDNEAGGESADVPILVHPLEVRDVATSTSGKRLTKFLWQYTSERSKFDMLRALNAAANATTASGKPSAATRTGAAGDEANEESTMHSDAPNAETKVTATGEDMPTQTMSDRQRSDSQMDAATFIAASVLEGTSEATLPRVESV